MLFLMQTVTTDEVMQKLPDLLREVKSRPVVIRDGDQAVGAIVSMDDYQVVRKAQVEQALKAMKDLGNVLRREAEREGLSLEELETMLETHTV
jgi:PHD/YefM family antitoxin component YafN of YafNO toxin-antitoxin module